MALLLEVRAQGGLRRSRGVPARTTRQRRNTLSRRLRWPAGPPGTPGFRLYFRTQAGALASPWHTVPLFAERGMLNMVCEIPRNTRAKFEVSTFKNKIKTN